IYASTSGAIVKLLAVRVAYVISITLVDLVSSIVEALRSVNGLRLIYFKCGDPCPCYRWSNGAP
ncbi:MAG: hypothetical protein ACRD22_21360, partial [Terriglobia bacterium]